MKQGRTLQTSIKLRPIEDLAFIMVVMEFRPPMYSIVWPRIVSPGLIQIMQSSGPILSKSLWPVLSLHSLCVSAICGLPQTFSTIDSE